MTNRTWTARGWLRLQGLHRLTFIVEGVEADMSTHAKAVLSSIPVLGGADFLLDEEAEVDFEAVPGAEPRVIALRVFRKEGVYEARPR